MTACPPSEIDRYYSGRPDTRRAMIWPVYGWGDRRFEKEEVAAFFSWGDAADYAMQPEKRHGWPRTLHIGRARRRDAR
jgi:hypothetical protein